MAEIEDIYDPCWLSNHLLIPSILAASKATSQRHMVLITLALSLVLVIDLSSNVILGVFHGRIISEAIALIAIKVRRLLFVPVLFSISHMYMRTLADIVIAWSYGLNVTVARITYRRRIKAVQILLPLLTCLPIFILAYFSFDLALDIIKLPFGYSITESTVYLIIPYCFNRTIQQIGVAEKVPAWCTYALYAAWLISLTCTIALYLHYFSITAIWQGFSLNIAIFALMAVWRIVGIT